MPRNTQHSDSLDNNQLIPINSSSFNLGQCIFSSTALKNEINNFPGTDYINSSSQNELSKDNIIINLHKLFKHCINPIIERFGNNLALTSVYRNKELNKLLGGVVNSQHTYGYAADMVLYDGTPSSVLFNWCKVFLPQYHQLIWEYPERGGFSPFQQPPLHIVTAPDPPGGAMGRYSDVVEDFDEYDPITSSDNWWNNYRINYTNFSWVHISYIEGNNEKINSVSSTDPKIHNAYKDVNTFYLDNFTHRISIANQSILK